MCALSLQRLLYRGKKVIFVAFVHFLGLNIIYSNASALHLEYNSGGANRFTFVASIAKNDGSLLRPCFPSTMIQHGNLQRFFHLGRVLSLRYILKLSGFVRFRTHFLFAAVFGVSTTPLTKPEGMLNRVTIAPKPKYITSARHVSWTYGERRSRATARQRPPARVIRS